MELLVWKLENNFMAVVACSVKEHLIAFRSNFVFPPNKMRVSHNLSMNQKEYGGQVQNIERKSRRFTPAPTLMAFCVLCVCGAGAGLSLRFV